MQRRWVVDFGPQWAESVADCDAPADRLELHIAAFKLDLERDPFMYSEAFGADARRVLQTTDHSGDGFVFTAYAILYENLEAHLMWVEAHPLPVRGEDDGD